MVGETLVTSRAAPCVFCLFRVAQLGARRLWTLSVPDFRSKGAVELELMPRWGEGFLGRPGGSRTPPPSPGS